MVKGPLPGHEMPQVQSSTGKRPAAQSTKAPFMVGAMWLLAAVCAAGAAITAAQSGPTNFDGSGWSVAGLIYAGWMLAGGAMFAAVATALHLLHRIATAVERRTSA